MNTYDFFQGVLFTLGSILLIVLIFLAVKMIFTLTKIDKLVEDINHKSKQLDSAFDVIDKVTDTVSKVNDKFIGIIFNTLTNLVHKIKNKKERIDDEDE